jgi:hypothetical protein
MGNLSKTSKIRKICSQLPVSSLWTEKTFVNDSGAPRTFTFIKNTLFQSASSAWLLILCNTDNSVE